MISLMRFVPYRTTLVIAATALLALTVDATAKELYVDAAIGDDSVTYEDNSATNPWASLGRAVWGNSNRDQANASEAAQAGDTVNVASGTYATSQGTGERYLPIYNPTNSGTPGNPITIRADGQVTLQSETNTEGEPIIGTFDRRYVVWDGFYIDEVNVDTKADTGPVVIWQSDNVTIQNLTVRGKTVAWGDNHNAIRVEFSSNSLIRNNRLFNNRGASNNYNGSAIMLYNSSGIVIEHNEIFDSQGGIFVKGGPVPNYEITIRYNLLYGLGVGIAHGVVNNGGRAFGARTYQNIVHSSRWGIVFIGYTGGTPANVDVVNNTVVGNFGAVFLKPSTEGYSDIEFRNNIFANSDIAIQGEDISDVSDTSFSHNLYFDSGTLARVAYTNHTFSSWRSQYNQDIVGSSVSNPDFVSVNSGDFRVQANSPAIGAGSDLLNLSGLGTGSSITVGAYITGDEDIGLTSEVAVLARIPSPPTLQ